MKGTLARVAVAALLAGAAVTGFVYRGVYLQYLPASWREAGEGIPTTEGYWTCTMHPHVQMDHEGTCPICSMNLVFVPAAQTAGPPGARAPSGLDVPEGTREDPYLADGLIREIQAGRRFIVIEHQDIPGLMPAMTMGFPVSEDVRLETLNLGDEARFHLEALGDGNYRIFAVQRGADPGTRPAGQPFFTVDTRRQQLIGVRTSAVSYRDFTHSIRAAGFVGLDETRISDVHAKISGWIEQTYVNFNFQHVNRGEPLFTIYSPELLATQQEYLIALRGFDVLGGSTFPSVAFGSEDLVRAAKRRLQLWDVSDEEIERIERTREPIRAVTVYSPATGHVTFRDAFPDKRVMPDTKLYTIADHSVVWIHAEVYENEMPWIRLGQPASVSFAALPGEVFSGRVQFVDPHVREINRTLRTRIELQNSSLRLRPGMYAEVELHAAIGRMLAVPESAVLPTGLRHVVFVDQGEGRMEIRNVRLGPKVQGFYQVLDGLREGERVVTSGNFLIDAESKIQGAEPIWEMTP